MHTCHYLHFSIRVWRAQEPFHRWLLQLLLLDESLGRWHRSGSFLCFLLKQNKTNNHYSLIKSCSIKIDLKSFPMIWNYSWNVKRNKIFWPFNPLKFGSFMHYCSISVLRDSMANMHWHNQFLLLVGQPVRVWTALPSCWTGIRRLESKSSLTSTKLSIPLNLKAKDFKGFKKICYKIFVTSIIIYTLFS